MDFTQNFITVNLKQLKRKQKIGLLKILFFYKNCKEKDTKGKIINV